jgi:hypothetical protein
MELDIQKSGIEFLIAFFPSNDDNYKRVCLCVVLLFL